MRLFACSLLGTSQRAFYDAAVAQLVERHPDRLRAIPRDSAHVTYSFLGHLPSPSLSTAVDALRSAAAATPPVAVTIGIPEVLFAGREARLIHAPIIDGARQLAELSERITRALEGALPGVAISQSRSAHVTLARFRRGTARRLAEPVVEALAKAGVNIRSDRFTAVHLISSELSGPSPVYATQASIPFGGQAEHAIGR